MLRSLAFKAMRQQQHQAAQSPQALGLEVQSCSGLRDVLSEEEITCSMSEVGQYWDNALGRAG